MGPEVAALLIVCGGIGWAAVLYLVGRKSAIAPLENVPPPERPKKMLFAFGDKAMAAAANRHGLRHELDVVSGKVDGFRVHIAAKPHGAAERLELEFEASVEFPRSLGLELDIRRIGGLTLGRDRVAISDAFDMVFVVRALHADQAQHLLADAVADALLYGDRKGWRPALDDGKLGIVVGGRSSEETVAEAFAWLIDTARVISQARADLPRPELEQRALSAFSSVAERRGGRVERNTDTLEIQDDLGTISVRVERSEGKAFDTVLEVALTRPVSADLHLGLESERSSLERWRKPDVQLQDEAFDALFLVKGEDEEAVRALLSQDARVKLLALAKNASAFELTPTRLHLSRRGAVESTEELEALLDLALEALGAVIPQLERSAYR